MTKEPEEIHEEAEPKGSSKPGHIVIKNSHLPTEVQESINALLGMRVIRTLLGTGASLLPVSVAAPIFFNYADVHLVPKNKFEEALHRAQEKFWKHLLPFRKREKY